MSGVSTLFASLFLWRPHALPSQSAFDFVSQRENTIFFISDCHSYRPLHLNQTRRMAITNTVLQFRIATTGYNTPPTYSTNLRVTVAQTWQSTNLA